MFPLRARDTGRRQERCLGTGPARPERLLPVRPPVCGRTSELAAAASETAARVLGEDAPLPGTRQDVEDLVCRLRGHIMQLGAAVAAGSPVLDQAQRMSVAPIPDGYVPSRVFLVRLAEVVQSLVELSRRSPPTGPSPSLKGAWRNSSRNAVRIAVFVLALVTLVIAASVPQDSSAGPPSTVQRSSP
ncbi:DUF6415 family natural product biosynthesis protein [Streptomyces ziwulingensis]|uniref:DUF6415 family natural product biosynthesis protein n=1 Tax=Streptomyces ziwulingensis TaxID=1045501 RepID=A0ABP9C4V4_9ACTN